MKRKRRCLLTTIFLLTLLKSIYMEYTDEIYDDNDRNFIGEDTHKNIISRNVAKPLYLNTKIHKRHFIPRIHLRSNDKHLKKTKVKFHAKRQNIPMIRIPNAKTFVKSTIKRSHLEQKELTFHAVVPSLSGAKGLHPITKDKIFQGNKDKAKQLELEDENPGSFYGSKANPAKSCRDIYLTNRDQESGNYWIKTADEELLLVTCGFPSHKQTNDNSHSETHDKKFENLDNNDSRNETPGEKVNELQEQTQHKIHEEKDARLQAQEVQGENKKLLKDSQDLIKSKETNNFIKSHVKDNEGNQDDKGRLGSLQEVPPMVKEYLLSNHIHVPGLDLPDEPTESHKNKDKSTVSEMDLRNPAPITKSPGPSNSMQKDNPNRVKSVPTKPPKYSYPKRTKTYNTLVPPLKPTPTPKATPRRRTTTKMRQPSTKAPRPSIKRRTTSLHTTRPPKTRPTKKSPNQKPPEDLEEFEKEIEQRPKPTRKTMVSTKQQKPSKKPTSKSKRPKTTLPPDIKAPPTLTPLSSTKEPEIIAPPPISKINGGKSSYLKQPEITQQFVTAEKANNEAKESEKPSFSGKPILPDNIKVQLPQLNSQQKAIDNANNSMVRTSNPAENLSQTAIPADQNKPFVLINGVSSDPRENPYEVEKQVQSIDYFAHSGEHVHGDGSLAVPANNVIANQKGSVEGVTQSTPKINHEPAISHRGMNRTKIGDGAGDLGDIQEEFPVETHNTATKETSNLPVIYGRRGNNVPPIGGEVQHPDKDIRNDYKAAIEFETQPQTRSWGFREKNMFERERYDKQYHEFEKLDKNNVTVKPVIEEGAFKKSWSENRQEMLRQKFKDQYDEFDKINQDLKEKEEGLPHMKSSKESYAAQYKAFEDFKNSSSNTTKEEDTNDKNVNTTRAEKEKKPLPKESFHDPQNEEMSEKNKTANINNEQIYETKEKEREEKEKKEKEREGKEREEKSDSYLNYVKAIEDNGDSSTTFSKNVTNDGAKHDGGRATAGKSLETNETTTATEVKQNDGIDQEKLKNTNITRDFNERIKDDKKDAYLKDDKKDAYLKEPSIQDSPDKTPTKDTEHTTKDTEHTTKDTTNPNKDTGKYDSYKEKEFEKEKSKQKERVDDEKKEKSDKLYENLTADKNSSSYDKMIPDNSTNDMVKIGKGNDPAMYTNAPLGTTSSNATNVESIDGVTTKVEDINATVMLTAKKDNTISSETIRPYGKSLKQIDVKQFLKNEKLNPSEKVHEDVVMDDEGSEVLDMFFKNKGTKKDESKENKRLKQLSGPPNPLVEKFDDNQENMTNHSQQNLNNDSASTANLKKESSDIEVEKLENKSSKEANGNNTEKFDLYKKLHGEGSIDPADTKELTTAKPSNIYVDNRVFIYGNVKGGSAPQLSHAIRNHNKEGDQTVERKLKIESNTDDMQNDDPALTKSSISSDKKMASSIKNENPDFAVTEETPDLSGMQPFQEVKEYDKKFNLNNLFKGSNISIENHVHTTGSLKALVRTAPMETKKPIKNEVVEKIKPKTIQFVIPEPNKLSFTNSNGKIDNSLIERTMEQEARINFIRKQALDQDDVSMGKFSTSGLKEFQYNKGQEHSSDESDSRNSNGKHAKQRGIIHRKPSGFTEPDRRTKMIDYLLKKKDTRSPFHLNQDIRDFGAIKKSTGLNQWLEAATANSGKKSDIVEFKKSNTAIPVQEDDEVDVNENNDKKSFKNTSTGTVQMNTSTPAENISIGGNVNADKKSIKLPPYQSPINQESLPGAGDVGDVFDGVEDETPPEKKQFNAMGVNNPNHVLGANMQLLLNNGQKSMGNVPGYTEENRREEQKAKENRNKNMNNNPAAQETANSDNNNAQTNLHPQVAVGGQESKLIHTINDTGNQLNGANLPGMDEQFSIRKRRSDGEIVNGDQIQLGNVASVEMNNKTFYLIYNLHPTNKSSDLMIPERMLENLTSHVGNAKLKNKIDEVSHKSPFKMTHSIINPKAIFWQGQNKSHVSDMKSIETDKTTKKLHHKKHAQNHRYSHHKHHLRHLNKSVIASHIDLTRSKKFNQMKKWSPFNHFVENEANRYSKNYSMLSDDNYLGNNKFIGNASIATSLHQNNSNIQNTEDSKNKTLSSRNHSNESLSSHLGGMIAKKMTSSALYFHSFQPKIQQVLDNKYDKVQLVSYDEPKDQFLSYGQDKDILQQNTDADFQNYYKITKDYIKPSRRTIKKTRLAKTYEATGEEKSRIGTRKNKKLQHQEAGSLNKTHLSTKNIIGNKTRKLLEISSHSSPKVSRLVAKKTSLKLYTADEPSIKKLQRNKTHAIPESTYLPTSLLDIRKIASPAVRLYQNIASKHDLKQLLFNGVFPEPKDMTPFASTTKKQSSHKISGSRARFFRNMELQKYSSHNERKSEKVRLKKSEIMPTYDKLFNVLSQLKRKRRSNDTDIDEETGVARMLIPSKVGHIQPSNIVPLPPVGHDPDEPPQSPVGIDQTETGKKDNEKLDEENTSYKNDTKSAKDEEKKIVVNEKTEKDDGKNEDDKEEKTDKKKQTSKTKETIKDDETVKTGEQDSENKTKETKEKSDDFNKQTEQISSTLPPVTEPHIVHPKTPHTTQPPPTKPDEKKKNEQKTKEQTQPKPHADSGPQDDKVAEAEANLPIPTEGLSNSTSTDIGGDSGKDEVGTGSKQLKIQSTTLKVNDKIVDTTFEAGLQEDEKLKVEEKKKPAVSETTNQTNNHNAVENSNVDLGEQQPNEQPLDLGNLTTFNYPVNVTVLEQGILQLINQTAPKLKTGREKLKEEMEKALREKNKQYPALKLPVKNGEYIPPDSEEDEESEPEPIAIPDNKKSEKKPQILQNTPLPPPKIGAINMGTENEFAEIIDSTPTESGFHITTVHATPKPLLKTKKEESKQQTTTTEKTIPKEMAKTNPNEVDNPASAQEYTFPSLQTEGSNQIPIIPIAKDSPLGKLLYPALGEGQTPTLTINDPGSIMMKNATAASFSGPGYSDILLKQTKKLLNEGKLNRRDLLRLLQTSKKQYISKQEDVAFPHEPSEQMFILFPDKNDDSKDLSETTPKINFPGLTSDIVNIPSLSGYYKNLNDQGEVRSKVTNSPVDSKTFINLPNMNNGGFTVQKYNNGLVLVPNAQTGERRQKLLPQNINLDVHYKITSTQKKNIISNRVKHSSRTIKHSSRILNDT